jgi:hypothetical protein
MGVSCDDIRWQKGNSGTRTGTINYRGVATMRIKLSYITPALGAAAAAFAIVAAPIAAAAAPSGPPSQSCGQSGAGTECQSPGNVQINDSPPPVSYYPYGGDAFLLGGYGYGGGHVAGGHGGGHR